MRLSPATGPSGDRAGQSPGTAGHKGNEGREETGPRWEMGVESLLVDHRPAVADDATRPVVRCGARDLGRGAQRDLVIADVGVVDGRGEDELVEPTIRLHRREV